jgi:hypothetical protein
MDRTDAERVIKKRQSGTAASALALSFIVANPFTYLHSRFKIRRTVPNGTDAP